MKKFGLTDECVTHPSGIKLYRIRALRDFGGVKKGDLGGFVEKESNLSHQGNCWIYDNAWVFENARVSGEACVMGHAYVASNAKVYGNARVSDNAKIFGNAKIFCNAIVYGNTDVYRNAQVYGFAQVSGYAEVSGNAQVLGDALVSVYERVDGDAFIKDKTHVFSVSRVGSGNGTLTVFPGKDELLVTRGCFVGTIEEFLEKSKEVHDDVTHREYQLLLEVAKSRIQNPFYLRKRD